MHAIETGIDSDDHEMQFSNLPSLIAAAHELKSPLALIRQLALSLECDAVTNTQKEKIIRQIALSSESALRLTTGLTKTARLDDALFRMEPVSPRQICDQVQRDLAPLYSARGKNIAVKSCKNPSLVVANRELLGRIVAGFSDNALHYSSENSEVQILISERDKHDIVRVSVRDKGPAINKKLFEQMIKTQNTPADPLRPQSSGLGLYIARQFASAMQASIGLIRHRDGASFYVDIQASKQLALL